MMDFNLPGDPAVPYEPPVSLWGLVEKHVPSNEWQEVKRILGESLVDQSLELHEEVNTLLEIWRDYREETHHHLTCQRLPEPPAARDRLKQEILFFVESLKQKAVDHGGAAEAVLKKHNTPVIQYVISESRPGSRCSSRPSTARSRDGRETPITARPSSTEQQNLAEDLRHDLQHRGDPLTSLNMDDVVQHLRETLEEEVKNLMQDTEFLQQCLDDEADFRSQSHFGGEPSLQDLRQSRSNLEKDLLSEDVSLPPPLRDPISKTIHSLKVKNPSLVSHPNQVLNNKPGPLKASHHIATEVTSETRPKGSINSPGKASVSLPKKPSEIEGFAQLKIRTRPMKGPTETTHVTIRTGSPLEPHSHRPGSSCPVVVPSPPTSAKPQRPPSPQRPSSASRFRRMVLECRDGST